MMATDNSRTMAELPAAVARAGTEPEPKYDKNSVTIDYIEYMHIIQSTHCLSISSGQLATKLIAALHEPPLVKYDH